MRLIVTHPSCSIKTPPCCTTSRFIVCHPGQPGPHRDRSPAAPLLLPTADPADCPTDVTQAVPGPLRGRSPAAPLLCATLLRTTDIAQAVPASYRDRSPAAPLLLPTADPLKPHRCHPGCPGLYRGRSPAAPLLMPTADTDVAQVVPASTEAVRRQHRCCYLQRTRRCPTNFARGVPAATTADRSPMQYRCCGLLPPRCCPTADARKASRLTPPWSFTGSTAPAGARR